ncbi:sacsin-like [Asterias rubens]|uniref:sacsin-like n=1 Tax=Asterias rubens TaxID=7604 RepID=UPI00145576CB|nr:sacsin-like [Asterias rubens]
MADLEDGRNFGQKLPPLHIYLKQVLDKYPEGGQILKELVQNADDAGATNVIFLFDQTDHPTQRLWSESLNNVQGAALYAYNDAKFTDKDWTSIQNPSQSGKIDDLAKVGRFGLGFISVYHLTDLPSILSGDTIGYLDPLEHYFSYDPHTGKTYEGKVGQSWKISSKLLNDFPHQFTPYLQEIFNCNESNFENGSFNGTIFRFPLRREKSKLSESLFDDENRVHELFSSFETDAEISLLFLKYVKSISVYEKGPDDETAKLNFKIEVPVEDRPEMHSNVQAFLTKIPENKDFRTLSCFRIHKQTVPDEVDTVSRYTTLNALRTEDASSDLRELINDGELKLLPWMGISFRSSSSIEDSSPDGRTFCFLPLPESEQTGLPVHVHGYFGLGDNRRGIKWPDKESLHDKKAQWNMLLVAEVFPKVYAELILAVIARSQETTSPMTSEEVYNAWPTPSSIKEEWIDSVKKSLQLLAEETIFYSDHEGGRWMKSSEVYIDTEDDPLFAEVLRHKQHPVTRLPNHVTDSLRWANVGFREVTPQVVRDSIRGDPLDFISPKEKMQLLRYVTRDTVADLSRLTLLPLQDGTFVPFCSSASTVYIASREHPSVLIPNTGTRLAANDMPKELEATEALTNSQLKLLQADDIAPLLREILPSNWIEGTDEVKLQWTPGCNHHPPATWLDEMWKWLTQNLATIQLQDFEGIPLIPMEHNKHITKLLRNTMIFHKEAGTPGSSNECLSESGCSFLESFGVVVLRHELPSYITSHPQLGRFIQSPNPEGVMAVLEEFAVKVDLKEHVEKANTNIKDELQRLLSQLRQIPSEQKIILRGLPIFNGSDGDYTSANSCERAVPSSFQEIPVKTLRQNRLILKDSLDNFANILDIHKDSVHELLEENVLPAVSARFYTDSESEEIMTWVLERPEYNSLVSNLPFIPTSGNQELSSPVELYEPTDELRVVFRDRPVFPTGVYSRDRLVGFLKQIGLKKDSEVTSKEVMEVAKVLSEGETIVDRERAVALLQHVNRFPHLLSKRVTSDGVTKPLFKVMEELAWVPCESSPPLHYPVSAGWFGKSNKLYLPQQISLIETAKLQGSVVALISMQDMKQDLLQLFGWSRDLIPDEDKNVEAAVRHLKNVTDNFSSTEETFTISNTVSSIYEYLGKASAPTLKRLFDKYVGDSQPWVWHGSGFTTPDKAALSIGTLGVSLAPYLHIIPEAMLKHRAFLETMDVQQTFQESALCTVLDSVKQKRDGQVNIHRTELEADLNLVCNILRYIATLERFDAKSSTILVPCRTPKESNILLMVPASDCLYVDEERLARQLYEEGLQDDLDKQVIHEQVSNDLAKRLGLDPLSHFIAPVEALEYDMAGPHETTVNAIKRNLDMYKEGVGIFKEMIQNADDAGATEVKFLIDWRKNEETANNLLSDGMKACHGPSIWAYNNARFSNDDIKNICSIAAQSKKHQLDKIGRFGLGFTSVYHLTDVPSIVSGPYVLICDPRTTHLGSRVQPGQPGIKLDLSNTRHRRTLKSYPNQFHPYNGIFGCDMHESTEGFADTLIRLPLRTESGATQEQNQLSHRFYDTKEQVEPLLESLKRSSDTLLLFTQNVVHVSVEELQSNDIRDIRNIISVKVERVLQLPRSVGGQDGDMSTERKLLNATSSAMRNPATAVPETTMVVKVSQEASEDHMTIEPQKEVLHFIISSCMENGEILTMARSDEGLRSCVLPCGGVAAELVLRDGILVPKCVDGKAFSYLPLDVSTGLPFHVNGNFLLQPNRRQLWSKPSSSSGEFESMWNECFIKSVLCRALLNLLKDLQELQDQHQVDAQVFQRLWPTKSRCETDFQTLVGAYYSAIVRSGNPPTVVYVNSQWVTVHDCFFTKWKHNDPEDLRSSIKSVLTKKMHPKTWVKLDSDVVSSIKKLPENNYFFDNTYDVHRFLKEVFFPILSSGIRIEPFDRDKIILYVLDLRLGEEKGKQYDTSLRDTRSIPVSPRGEVIVQPKMLVNPRTSIGSLFSEADSRFPYGDEYRNGNRLLSLEQLGMESQDLCWEDICERAESMVMDEGRSKILLKLIDKKLRQGEVPTLEQKRRIREAQLLPVFQKPELFPLEWHDVGTEFMPANSMYECKHVDLIGSVHPLLDEARLGPEAMNETVKIFLGFKEKKVKVNDVIKQLARLITTQVTHESSSIAHNIYTFLQHTICVCDDDHIDVAEEYISDFNHLCTLGFVLCEGEFRECKQIAFNYKGRSGPYLFSKPPMLSQFSNLLKVCGVKDNFDLEDYVETLQYLKATYGEACLPDEAFRAAKDMIVEIVARLVNPLDETDQKPNCLQNGKVFVPDNAGVLRKPSELTFNDMPWEDDDTQEVYTHPDVTYKHAKALGIATAREKGYDKFSSCSGFESDFGQVEELTDRLRNILRDYPNVSDVLKELLQNSDDAGATEIHFVYDPRKHSAQKIISDSWAKIQTLPAMCVYNNRPFSEADIKGIQKVGIGGKRDDIATTGRFGIGFNSVYHLTDCPSFLSSKDTLCVFDPLLKYAPRARKESPGQQFQTREEFRKKFPDMLSGFLEDFDEFSGSEGTMFRLPLRSTESAISGEVFSGQVVEELLKGFEKVSMEALLFLNNIKKISISCVDEQTHTLDTKYVISAELTDQDQKHREELVKHLKDFKNTPCQDVQSMCRVYRLLIQDTRESKQTWLVSQMLGFHGLPPEENFQLSSATSLKKPLPRGGVAALISEGVIQPKYKAYCFLPLPIHTQLPVHVNGMFELDSSRKNLKKGDFYTGSPILKWNSQLIKYVIAPAYAELLLQAGRNILNKAEDRSQYKDPFAFYDELFPKHLVKLRDEWELLAKETLSLIGRENRKVLPVARRKEQYLDVTWHHPNSNSSATFFDRLNRNEAADALRSFLLRVGFNLLKSSSELCKAFNECGVKAEFVSSKVVVKHMSTESVVSPSLPAPLEETAFEGLVTFKVVFKYCLDGITHPTQLEGLPFRLANDCSLDVVKQDNGLYVSSHWRVLPSLKNLFVHDQLVEMCTEWFRKNRSTSPTPYSTGVFKKFTIFELSRHLGRHLPGEWHECNHHVDWTPNINGHPTEEWLKTLWTFICSDERSDTCLEPIERWPILPTTSGKLVPPRLSKRSLLFMTKYPTRFTFDIPNRTNIIIILRKLGLPEVNLKGVTDCEQYTPTSLLNNYLARLDSQGDVLNVIQHAQEKGGFVCDIPQSDCTSLLRYFQEAWSKSLLFQSSLSHENFKTIKSLPIFILSGGAGTTDLHHSKNYHRTDGYALLMVEAKIWMGHTNCVFIQPDHALNLIYDKLGIVDIKHADVYLKYILPSFKVLSLEAQKKHMSNIKAKLRYHVTDNEYQAILIKLSSLEFIKDMEQNLRRADCFYDPSNPVFKAMVDKNDHLPEQMAEMKDFLAEIGLNVDVTAPLFIGFAKEVELRARNMTDSQIKSLGNDSTLLTEELKHSEDLQDNQSFLREVAQIKFIPPNPIKPELTDIHPAFSESGDINTDRVHFIAYKGSVPNRHCELVWSVANLLPRHTIPTNRTFKGERIHLHGCLGIEDSLDPQKVVTHIQNVCLRMEQRNVTHKEDQVAPKVRETLKAVMIKILHYLQKNVETHVEYFKRNLQQTPICLVASGTMLVRVNQLVYELKEDHGNLLCPYLFKVPMKELSEFYSVLKILGAQDQCSFDQFAGVLSTLQRQYGDEKVGPNEENTALCAMSLMFQLLAEKKEKCTRDISISELFLLSSDIDLRKTSDLCYAEPHIMKQLHKSTNKKFVVPLTRCGIAENEDRYYIELLPEQLRPKNIGDSLTEKPLESCSCLQGTDCAYLTHIKLLLNSEEMTQVLLRLIQHQLKPKSPSKETEDSIRKLRSYDKIICKMNLEVGLYDTEENFVGQRNSSRKAFFDRNTSVMLLLHHELPFLARHVKTTFKQIAECCNDFLGRLLNEKNVGHLQTVLASDSPNEMNDTLSADCNIPEYGIVTQEQEDEHSPGKIVPRDMKHLLDQDPYNMFKENEVVGFERNIALPLIDHSQSRLSSRDNFTEIVYAVIIKQTDKLSGLDKHYRIDIGEDAHIDVSVVKLYKFIPPEKAADTTDRKLPGSPEQDNEQIKREVAEAFTLSEYERQTAIRRLYRKWHPDKNLGEDSRATQAFQFLKQQISSHDSTSHYSQHFSHWEAEATRSYEDETYYRKRYRHRYRNGRSKYGLPFSFIRETPDPVKAWIWFLQAKEHFSTAQATSHIQPVPGKQWIAFQIHQAAELALKAAQYSLTGRPDTDCHELMHLAWKVCSHREVHSNDLVDRVYELNRLDCHFSKPRYPEIWQTSGQVFTDFCTKKAFEVCEKLFILVRDIIGT